MFSSILGLSLLSCLSLLSHFYSPLHLHPTPWKEVGEVLLRFSVLLEATCLSEQRWNVLSTVNFFLSLRRAYFITKEVYEGDKNILICSTGYGSLSLTTGLC